MASVCVDDNFEVNDGVLSLAKCGDPANTPWPYTANPTNANGLRLDEGCGLWAPPDKIISRWSATQNTTLGVSLNIGGQTATSPPLTLSVTNPSNDFSMLLILQMFNLWRYGQVDQTFTVAKIGWSKDNPAVTTYEVGSHFRGDTNTDTQTGWLGSSTDTINDVLNPGQTATYRLVSAMTHALSGLGGTSQYLQTTEKFTGFGITITQ